MARICALPGCSLEIGTKPYKLGSYPGLYCSNDCVNDAFMRKKAGKVFAKDPKETKKEEETSVQLPAEDFGESGVIRRFCDDPTCHRPVTLEWRSRSGKVYCSNECLKRSEKPEKENKQMTTEDEDSSPIAPATKKAGGKKVTKKAVAKKAEPKKAAPSGKAVGTPRWPADAVITVKKTDHGKKGNGAEALDLMKSGMTIEKYKAALEKKGRQGMFAWAVKYATDNDLATVK